MALIHVSYELIDNEEMFNLLCDSFDEIKEVRDDPYYKILRVQHEEIPKEDVVICPEFYRFEGVKPFIIGFD